MRMIDPNRRWVVAALVLVVVRLAGCSGSGSRQAEVTTIPLAADTLFTIGGADGPDDEILSFVSMHGAPMMDRGPDGLLWVVNPAESNLSVYDPTGKKLRSMGRGGHGPGEFDRVEAMIALEGEALTWDWRNQQLCRWSASGQLLEIVRTELPQPSGGRTVLEADGTIWFWLLDWQAMTSDSVTFRLLRFPRGAAADTLRECVIPAVTVPGSAMAPSYGPNIARAPGGGVVVSESYTYDLVHVTAAEATEWHLPTNNVLYTDEERDPSRRGGIVGSDGKIQSPPLMPHKIDVADLLWENPDGVWVRTPVRDEAGLYQWDRFDAEGRRTDSRWMIRGITAFCREGSLAWVLGYTPEEGQLIYALSLTAR